MRGAEFAYEQGYYEGNRPITVYLVPILRLIGQKSLRVFFTGNIS